MNQVTPAMTDERVEIEVLTKHWDFYHPISMKFTAEELKSWGLKGTGQIDPLTGLKIMNNPKNEKTIMVADVDSILPPTLIIVDDWGDFRAVYDPKTLAEVICNPRVYIKSRKKISFTRTKWEVDVYEEFGCLPEALIYNKRHYIFVKDDKVVPPEATLEGGDFPCPAFNIEGKPTQMGLLNHSVNFDEKKFHQPEYEGEYWKKWNQGYTHPGVHYPTTTYVATKQCCAYNATEEYLQSILGVKLSSSDRAWYVAQDRVQMEGLPLQCTIEVLNELVAPYGLEINRVWVNEFSWTDELTRYAPIMIVENELYHEMKTIAPMPDPRIFLTPVPDGVPVVSMAKGNSAGTDGHASYLAPRSSRSKDWKIALDYRRIA